MKFHYCKISFDYEKDSQVLKVMKKSKMSDWGNEIIYERVFSQEKMAYWCVILLSSIGMKNFRNDVLLRFILYQKFG